MTSTHDFIVIGGGVIGCSVAYHLMQLGARDVLLLERDQVGAGTTSQSSGILRTHYSVPENVTLARRSWSVFKDLAGYLDDPDAASGLIECGYLITADEGPHAAALLQAMQDQRHAGIDMQRIDAAQARALLPIAQFDERALIGFEPEAGFADAYLVNTAFARAFRRRGGVLREGVGVQRLVIEGGMVRGVETSAGSFHAGTVISTQNIWSRELEAWTGIRTHLSAERHIVLALEGEPAYTNRMPVFKDLSSPGMLYCRSYGGRQMLVSEGRPGEVLATPSNEPGDVSLDTVASIGEQVAQRFPSYAEAGLASSWTGVYDVTPDWNPILGRVPGVERLVVGYGFSGHGFKLSPAIGRLLAQEALGLPTEVPLAPYAIERFDSGRLLVGRYGGGAVS